MFSFHKLLWRILTTETLKYLLYYPLDLLNVKANEAILQLRLDQDHFEKPYVRRPLPKDRTDRSSLPARMTNQFLPFPRNKKFFGRQEELKHIHNSLTKPPNDDSQSLVKDIGKATSTEADTPNALPSPLLVLITGLGGIGKTQLALEYAYSVSNERVIVWLSCKTLASLSKGFAKAAVALGLCDTETQSFKHQDHVLRWLESTGELWYLCNAQWTNDQ